MGCHYLLVFFIDVSQKRELEVNNMGYYYFSVFVFVSTSSLYNMNTLFRLHLFTKKGLGRTIVSLNCTL